MEPNSRKQKQLVLALAAEDSKALAIINQDQETHQIVPYVLPAELQPKSLFKMKY